MQCNLSITPQVGNVNYHLLHAPQIFKNKMSISTNVYMAKPEWQNKLQNQHSTYNGWLQLFRISTLNDMPRSNTEEEKRTNNHYQNAESSLENIFIFHTNM